jgi:hypothetical protein
MRFVFTITLLFAVGIVSAQEKTVKDTLVYKYTPRYFNPAPCGCYSFPKKDSTYVKKDTLKPIVVSAFARKRRTGTKKPPEGGSVFSIFLKLLPYFKTHKT